MTSDRLITNVRTSAPSNRLPDVVREYVEGYEREALGRALYAEYRERIPGLLTWENDSKADEFRAQADRLLPHLRRSVVPVRQGDPSDAGIDAPTGRAPELEVHGDDPSSVAAQGEPSEAEREALAKILTGLDDREWKIATAEGTEYLSAYFDAPDRIQAAGFRRSVVPVPQGEPSECQGCTEDDKMGNFCKACGKPRVAPGELSNVKRELPTKHAPRAVLRAAGVVPRRLL